MLGILSEWFVFGRQGQLKLPIARHFSSSCLSHLSICLSVLGLSNWKSSTLYSAYVASQPTVPTMDSPISGSTLPFHSPSLCCPCTHFLSLPAHITQLLHFHPLLSHSYLPNASSILSPGSTLHPPSLSDSTVCINVLLRLQPQLLSPSFPFPTDSSASQALTTWIHLSLGLTPLLTLTILPIIYH